MPHELRHKRSVKVHSHLEAAGAQAVGNGSHGTAHNVSFGLKKLGGHGTLECEAILRGVAGNGEECVSQIFCGSLNLVYINTFLRKPGHTLRAAAAEHAAHSADEGLRADAVQEYAVKAAVGEETVENGNHVRGVLRVGRAVEPEPLSRREVVVGRQIAPKVYRQGVVAHFFRFCEHRKPEKHFNAFGVEMRPYLFVDACICAPANYDLFQRYDSAYRVQAVYDFPGRIIGIVPAAKGYLDYVCWPFLPLPAAHDERQRGDDVC